MHLTLLFGSFLQHLAYPFHVDAPIVKPSIGVISIRVAVIDLPTYVDVPSTWFAPAAFPLFCVVSKSERKLT